MPDTSRKARAMALCQTQKQDLEDQITVLHVQLSLLEDTMRRLADMPSDVAERLAGVLTEADEVPGPANAMQLRWERKL